MGKAKHLPIGRRGGDADIDRPAYYTTLEVKAVCG